MKVSEIGFGCWAIGGNKHGNSYGPTDDEESIAAIETALELGCNYFDTADAYGWGHSESLLGRVLKGRRDAIVLASKVGSDFYQGYGYQSFESSYVRFALEKTFERLATDYLDVYMLHNPSPEHISQGEIFEIMQALKREGKIRCWGVSARTVEEAQLVLESSNPDCLQFPYNIFSTNPEEELLPAAYAAGCAILARESLANGFLTGKYTIDASFEDGDIRKSWPSDYINARVKAASALNFLDLDGGNKRTLAQAALSWVLRREEVSVVIVGVKTEAQALENFDLERCRPLNQEELSQVQKLQSSRFGLD